MRVYTTIEQAQQLPSFHQETIPDSYLDAMGHMNIRYYMALFDDGAWKFFNSLGMTETYYRENQAGAFALRQFITYVNEAHAGDKVAVHTRIVGHSEKRIHFIHFLVNETKNTVAATMEVLGSHADLQSRRTSPYPPEILANIAETLQAHQSLYWQAPLCGILSA